MAAIYSGIHLKLKSPHTQWEDKLKLARFAWISTQCLLPNKEQVLLDWCTHALTGRYNQKVEFSENVLEGLWCYLDDLLHSKKLHSLLKQGKTVSLRLNMAQLLLDRLQECARVGSKSPVCVSTILSVCQGLLSSPALSSVFTTKYELIVDLLAKLCSLACCQLQQPLLTEPLVTESVTCGDERQQANPNRVSTMVTNQLIQPLVLLRHLLTSGEFAAAHTHLRLRQQLSRDVRIKIDSILQLALFPSEHLTAYKDELLPSKEESGKRAKGPLKPVSAILSKLSAPGYCEPALHYTVKSNTMSLLFKFFVESYGKGRGESEETHRMLCFYFLTRLVPTLDMHLDENSPAKADQPVPVTPGQKSPPSSPCPPESWSLALLAVESLLNQTLSADIYNVAADRIRHAEVQLKFYGALGQMLFNHAQPSIPAWYRCLKALLSLNHLIIEPDLDQLLSSAWVDSECIEARVQRARQLLVCSLLQTYTKLRQLPRFFSELLTVICQPASDNLRPPLLSEGASASLRTCLLDTPSSQGLEICSLVLESIRTHILPDMVQEEREAEKMEIDGEVDDNGAKKDQSRKDASQKLFSLSQLLHVVLFSLKTLDNASPLPIVRQSQALMGEMQQVVKELLNLLSTEEKAVKTSSVQSTPRKRKNNVDQKKSEQVSEYNMGALWEQKTFDATLLLRYTLVEVDTLFDIHCSKYTALTAAASETEDRAPVLTQIESLLSSEIVPSHLQPSCSPLSRLLLKLLTLQQMKKVLLDTPLLSEPNTAALLNSAAQFILAKSELELSLNGEQVWDGQIASVTSSSYLAAHWYLITSNLPLIAPYLTGEDVGCVADMLVGSLLSRQTNGGKGCPPGSLSVSLVSSQLIQSPVLAELPSLFSATVCSLSDRIVSVLKAAHIPKVCPTLLKIQEKGTGACERLPLSTLVNKETIVEDILASSKAGEVSVLLTDTQSKELLLRILTCFLEGRNFQSVLKLIHGGTLLQASVSSLLWRSNNGAFGVTSSSDWLDLIKEAQGFIRALVQLIIIRNSSVRLNLDQFASYLTTEEMSNMKIVAPSSTAVSGKPGASILSVHLLLASLTSFSQAMTSNLGKSKQMDQTLTQMLTRTTASLGPAVESILKPQTVSESPIQPASVLGQAFVVEVVTVMLHCELSSLSVEDENKQKQMRHMALYQGCCQQILKEISCAHRPLDFLVSSLHFLSTFYKAILQNVHRLLTASWLSASDVCELEPAVQELLRHLLEKSTTGRFNLLLLLIREGLDTGKLRAGNYREVLSAVIIIKLLSCCQLPEPCSKALWLIAPQIISAMVFLVKSSTQDISLTVPFTVPTVTSMTSLLRQGEGLLTNPHHVLLILGALQSVPLDHLTPPVYHSVFLSVHEALFAIIQRHPQVMLNAAPSFLNVFYRLVASIMQEGRQRGDSDTDGDVYLQCSRLIERMYSHIAATAESFTTLSAFMVAQYVTELQKPSSPLIFHSCYSASRRKAASNEGIYRILDLCMEQDIKFLTAGLQMGVREVFNELYGSYTHYHKAQRQGEEKYTV
ncbi:Unhealthy ribosome biogenesis protein 2 like [Dissostichus eleginoides]|uniref:Unhealthy ribosome biogenesis protein 2 like n=1 Tax=Dissostichus eleginoides TaxID=100907 RepID=A0AAD9BW96_DISEL|nr:Unhealthy ribosome biogenesis protein 2 like [Dissostichus eleginoides]